MLYTMKKYFIALGTNLETTNMTKIEIINKTLACLSKFGITLIRVSSFWESKSYPDKNQPNFINAVSEVRSELNPYQFLDVLKEIEIMFGRKKNTRWGNRVLDLDILGSGSLILPNLLVLNKWIKMPLLQQTKVQPDELILPHPRIQDRLFVLKPLSEVGPNWVHPVLNKNILELINLKSWNEENYLKRVNNKKY